MGYGLFFVLLSCTNTDAPSHQQQIRLPFDKLGESLFIVPRMWGVAGNHTVILIKTDPEDRMYNKATDYAFACNEIYYKQSNDTLTVYAPSDAIMPKPEGWKSRVVVLCEKLVGFDQVMHYRSDYKNYGLEKVGVYPAPPRVSQ